MSKTQSMGSVLFGSALILLTSVNLMAGTAPQVWPAGMTISVAVLV